MAVETLADFWNRKHCEAQDTSKVLYAIAREETNDESKAYWQELAAAEYVRIAAFVQLNK